jgi:hypothetical protein
MEPNPSNDEDMHEGDIFSFWNELIIVSWPFNFYQYFQASTDIFSYWAVENIGDLQSTGKGLEQGIKMYHF